MTDLLWTPSQARIEAAHFTKFVQSLPEPIKTTGRDYDILWQWSIDHMDEFWTAVWDYTGVVGDRGNTVIENRDRVKEARFFPQASINYAENLLRHSGDAPAIIFHPETGERQVVTWDELRARVSVLQQALANAGIGVGDRVAGYVPNTPDTVIAMLAATSLGAVWSSCSPDFGFNGVSDRFGQIEPKALICADAYHYNGKVHDCLETAGALASAIPSIQNVIVCPYVNDTADLSLVGAKAKHLREFTAPFNARDLTFERVGFNDPLFVMFSSGTTGLPKCIVHSVGGTLLQHMKEQQLNCDIHSGDRFFYFTTCGWMMWNWLVTGLATGASLILYDGSPFYPDGNRLADIADAENTTHFGTSAKYLDACAKGGIRPAKTHSLDDLRVIMSTGSPLAPEGFDYVYSDWKADVCLSSIAGGTDICGCFVGGSPVNPVYRGQCQKRILGMDVQVFDDAGKPMAAGPGELVCASPHPSQPVGFWNDPDGQKYHDAYFAKFDNIWHHGDWVVLKPEGGMVFFGRSDAVLNPGGVRIGTAEIYRQVERVEEVLEGLVIGQQWDSDVRVILFVRLRDGVELDDALIKHIKTEIRQNATPRHVPAKIIAVADIPRTKSGKITELAVRDIVHGRPVKNTEAMANPAALDLFKDLAELQV